MHELIKKKKKLIWQRRFYGIMSQTAIKTKNR